MYSLSKRILYVALLVLGGFGLMSGLAVADTVNLAESQKDAVKCVRSKGCTQITTGTYSATIKLSASLLKPILEPFLQGTADAINQAPLAIELGAFSHSNTISLAKAKKMTKNTLQASWVDSHAECSKYNNAGVCKKSRAVVDGTVKINLDVKNGGVLKLTGQSSSVSERGQKIYANQCLDNNAGNITDKVTVTIGQQLISAPLNIACRVKKTQKSGFGLVNIGIAAKLPPVTSFTLLQLIKNMEHFFVAPRPVGYVDNSGFNEFTGSADGFVSLQKQLTYRKAEVGNYPLLIDFVYYLSGSSVHLASPSLFNDLFGSTVNLGWKTYTNSHFSSVYSTRSYFDSNGNVLYYGLSEEEFDAVKNGDGIMTIVNHSQSNVLNYQTSNDVSFGNDQNDKLEDTVIFAVADSNGGVSLIKIIAGADIYALRMEVKRAY